MIEETSRAPSKTAGFAPSPAMQTAALKLFWGLCRLLPRRAAGALGASILARVGPRTSRNRKILQNFRVAFPEKSEAEARALAVEAWRNFGRVLAEFATLGRILKRGRARSPFVYDIEPETQRLIDRGKPMIFAGAHISNWEYTALGFRLMGAPLSVVYSKLQEPHIDQAIREAREGMACGLIAKSDGIRPLIQALNSGDSIGFVIDRRINSGAPVEFFGHPTFFSQAPAKLAMRFDSPVVPAFISRLPDGRIKLQAGPPIWAHDFEGSDAERAAAVTRQVMSVVEAEIRRRPGDWLCSQRIWPHVAYDDREGRAAIFALDA